MAIQGKTMLRQYSLSEMIYFQLYYAVQNNHIKYLNKMMSMIKYLHI